MKVSLLPSSSLTAFLKFLPFFRVISRLFCTQQSISSDPEIFLENPMAGGLIRILRREKGCKVVSTELRTCKVLASLQYKSMEV